MLAHLIHRKALVGHRRRCRATRVNVDRQHTAQQIADRADVIPRTQKQGARAHRRRLAHAQNPVGDLLRRQHSLDRAVRYPVGVHVVELDHRRAGQQQGQDHLGGFFRGCRIAHLGIAGWPGKGTDQLAQIGLATAEHRRTSMKPRRMRQRRAHHGGEDRRQRRRFIGGCDEVEFREQVFQQGQCHPCRVGCRVGNDKLPRIEHAEPLRRLVVTGLRDEFAVRLPEIGLSHHTRQRWQITKALRIVKNRRVPRRWIAAHPVFRAPVVFLPGRRHRQFPRQCRCAGRHYRWIAAGRVSRDRDNQAARLIMPPTVRQLLLRRIHYAVQVTSHHADHRLVSRFGIAHTEEFE